MKRLPFISIVFGAVIVVALSLSVLLTAPGGAATILADGCEPNGNSVDPRITPDGRYILFDTSATNLIPGDTSGVNGVMLYDQLTDTVERISTDSEGNPAAFYSSRAVDITPDGRYVAFVSSDDSLVPDDTNGENDVFVKDRQTGVVERVSVDADGRQLASRSYGIEITSDGRYVFFGTPDTNILPGDADENTNTFVKDRVTGAVEPIVVIDEPHFVRDVSSDGRYVVFDNGVAGSQVYVHDRTTGITELISADANGTPGDDRSSASQIRSISDDGRYVAFVSSSSNLIPNDTNGDIWDIFVKDRVTGAVEAVSRNTEGDLSDWYEEDFAISPDGRYVVFESGAENFFEGVFHSLAVKDRVTGELVNASSDAYGNPANTSGSYPDISEDGRYVVFNSAATNLVPGTTDDTRGLIYIKDMETGVITRITACDDPPVPTVTPTPTETPTATITPTVDTSVTETPAFTETPGPSATPTDTVTATPTDEPSPTATPTAEPETVLIDGGFESSASGEDWVLITSGDNGDGRFAPPAVYQNEGEHILLFAANGGLEAAVQTIDGLSGTMGETVTLSMDYAHVGLSDDGLIGGRIILRGEGGAQQVVNCIIAERSAPTTLWTPFTCEAIAEIAYDSVTVLIGTLDVSGGLLGFDAVELTIGG